MNEVQRQQYLDAMGIQAWISKEKADARAVQAAAPETRVSPLREYSDSKAQTSDTPVPDLCFEIGPGTGQTLLLCGRRAEASSQLASDIARCLDEVPVWGWQLPGGSTVSNRNSHADEAGLSLERAIKERLFTRVLVFAAGPAKGTGGSEVLGSARVIYAPPLALLATSPEQKRNLWQQLVGNGWTAKKN
jgi:hypothetical protein